MLAALVVLQQKGTADLQDCCYVHVMLSVKRKYTAAVIVFAHLTRMAQTKRRVSTPAPTVMPADQIAQPLSWHLTRWLKFVLKRRT